MSLNNCTVSGRLTDEPKITTTKNDTIVASFSLAVNEYYNNKEHVSYINCTAFGKIAERLQKFNKGRAIAIVGSLRQERWEDRGEKKSMVKILVSRLEDLDFQKSKNTEHQPRETSATETYYDTIQSDIYDDDIPF